MTVEKLELADEQVRIHGPVENLTGVGRIVAVRDGKESDVRSQMIALYAQENEKIVLVHFRTTPFKG